jgi:hypothetical protein
MIMEPFHSIHQHGVALGFMTSKSFFMKTLRGLLLHLRPSMASANAVLGDTGHVYANTLVVSVYINIVHCSCFARVSA